ncbi:MAG: exosortase system-associated protein, TIGR04073 family [Lentisphaeria bacterium]|nr:exosortase system-associated protein, TIGR04073 family [Lentisphaeria bacterium]
MMKCKRVFAVVGLFAALFFCGGTLSAVETEDVNSQVLERPILDQMGEKLGRGVANVAFGPLEILIQPYDVAQDKGAIASLTYGVFRGIFFVVAREILGVVDIATFFMPLPGATWDPNDAGWGYGPYMRPAWVVDVEHNAFNFFFDEQAIVVTE